MEPTQNINADAGGKRFVMGEAIRFGWGAMKKHFWFFLGVIVVTFVINSIPGLFARLAEGGLNGRLIYYTVAVVCWILQIFISLGWVNIALKIVDGQELKFADVFPDAIKTLKYLGAYILYSLVVMVGLILLIFPGIIWGVKYQFFPYLVLEGAGPLEALTQSGKITKGAKWNLFLFGILILLINLLGLIVFVVGLLVTIPVTAVAVAAVYRQLKNADGRSGRETANN